jgi:hypothetical protein
MATCEYTQTRTEVAYSSDPSTIPQFIVEGTVRIGFTETEKRLNVGFQVGCSFRLWIWGIHDPLTLEDGAWDSRLVFPDGNDNIEIFLSSTRTFKQLEIDAFGMEEMLSNPDYFAWWSEGSVFVKLDMGDASFGRQTFDVERFSVRPTTREEFGQ